MLLDGRGEIGVRLACLRVRRATQRPVACARIMASGTGESARSVRPGSKTSIATTKDREKSTVSQISMVNSRTPTPRTSTSPTIRAIRSPTGVRCTSAIGHASTPRNASARTFARIRALAVMSHQRFAMRGSSVSSVPATNASAAQPTSAPSSRLAQGQGPVDRAPEQDRRQDDRGVHDDAGHGSEDGWPATCGNTAASPRGSRSDAAGLIIVGSRDPQEARSRARRSRLAPAGSPR